MDAPSARADHRLQVSFVELVLVHGMGRQRARETLLRWAEPLVRRIDWLAGDDAAARLVRVDLGVDDDPRVVIATGPMDAAGSERIVEITITEARWAESFFPLSRGETFVWGLSYLRRTVGRLGGFLARLLVQFLLDVVGLPAWASARTRVPFAVWLLLCTPLTVAAAVLVLVLLGLLGVGLAVVLLASYAFLILVGPVLLLPGVARVLGPIVELVVEFIGDAAAWTRRPVRAAAIRVAVEEALTAAEQRLAQSIAANGGEGRLIVLGHSQGASIAADVLFNRPDGFRPPRVDALVTVGAAVTLLGRARWSGPASDEPAMENPVTGWSSAHPAVRWLNFWALFDPFPSGPISTTRWNRLRRWRESFGGRAGGGAPGPEEHPVHNTAWPFTDHLGYAGNIPQVIDPIARIVLGPDLWTAEQREHALARSRRHARGVRALGLQRLLVLAVAATVGVLAPTLVGPVAWFPAVFPELLGDRGPWLVLALAVAVLGLWVNEALWRHHASEVAWRRMPQPLPHWRAGVLFRTVLLVLLSASVVVSWPTTATVVVTAVVALVLLVAPAVGPLPSVAPARRAWHGRATRRD